MSSSSDTFNEGMKAIPPLAITGMTFLGFPMSDWVLALTAIYTSCQILLLMRKALRTMTTPAPASCNGNCPLMRQGAQDVDGDDD